MQKSQRSRKTGTVDAERDQLQLRNIYPYPSNYPQPISASQREIHDGQSDVELAHTLEQRNFIPHHRNRLKLSLKEASYALHQAKMPVRQKRATSLLQASFHFMSSP